MRRVHRYVVLFASSIAALVSQLALGADIVYLDGHTELVRDVGVPPDGKWLVSVGNEGRIVLRKTDDLKQSQTFQPREGGLMCLAFDHDGSSVLAAGNLAYFMSNDSIDGAIRVSLDDKHTTDFIQFPVRGTIQRMALFDDDSTVIYFCASKELLTLKLGARDYLRETRIFGGFTGTTAISPGIKHFAVTSQNEVNNESAEPCQLSVFVADGQQTLSWQFQSERDYRGAQLCFPTDEQLVLCLPTGKLMKWRWSADQKHWATDREPVPIPVGRLSAAESQGPDGPLWLAADQDLISVDAASGKELQRITLKVGTSKRRIDPPIGCVAIMPEATRIVAGLRDGRLAVVPIEGVLK